MIAPAAIREIMVDDVETVPPDASAAAAAVKVHEEGIGSVVVVDGEDPVGIITQEDLIQLLATDEAPEARVAADIMSSPLITVAPDDGLESAVEKLQEHTIKRLPVVEEGRLVGIVTTTDISYFIPQIALGPRAEGEGQRGSMPELSYQDEDWETEFVDVERGDIAVGDRVRFTKELTDEDVRQFADITGDTNRLHLDDEFAGESRFGGRIAHGTLVAGLISAGLARLPGLTIYLSQDLSFQGPVPVGATVTAICEVVQDLGKRRYRLSTRVVHDDEVVIDGEATVIVDELVDEPPAAAD